MDDYTCVVYTQLLFLKLEVPDVFKDFKAAAGNKSGRWLHEVMMDNVHEPLMGKMHDTCKCGVKLHTTPPYHPALNSVAECAIRVLTVTVCTMLHDVGMPKKLWAGYQHSDLYVQ